MKNQLVVEAELREITTRGAVNAMRANHRLPAVVYGGKKPPVSISVSEKELRKALQAGGANAILTLKSGKGEDTVIVKEIVHDPVDNKPLHVDFQRISLKDKITVKVHLKVVGEAPGVKLQGGILEHILRELEVKVLPTEIPSEIPVDVSTLEITKSLRVSDLTVPQGVEVLTQADSIVVNIVAPKEEKVEAPAAAEGAAAEPEVIAKGKEAKEGAEGAAAAPGKAPAAGEKKAPEKK